MSFRITIPTDLPLTGVMLFAIRRDYTFSQIRNVYSQAKVGFRARRPPFTPERLCYAGWMWVNLNARCVPSILDFVDANSAFVKYFHRTHVPDESFIHTILLNDKSLKIKNDPLRFVHWGEHKHPTSPELLKDMRALRLAIDSQQPLGRKFDDTTDLSLIAVLDERIRS